MMITVMVVMMMVMMMMMKQTRWYTMAITVIIVCMWNHWGSLSNSTAHKECKLKKYPDLHSQS